MYLSFFRAYYTSAVVTLTHFYLYKLLKQNVHHLRNSFYYSDAQLQISTWMTNISLNLIIIIYNPSRIIPDTFIVQYTINETCIQRINLSKAKMNRRNCCLYNQSSAVYCFICAPSICKKKGKKNRKGSWICGVLNQVLMTWVSLFRNVNMLSSKLISMMI